MTRKGRLRKRCSGQVLSEFVLMLLTFVLVAAAMKFLLSSFYSYGFRVLSLIAWEPFS